MYLPIRRPRSFAKVIDDNNPSKVETANYDYNFEFEVNKTGVACVKSTVNSGFVDTLWLNVIYLLERPWLPWIWVVRELLLLLYLTP
jgi:hypothetical protein